MELYIVKIIIFGNVNLAQNIRWSVVENTTILTGFKSEYMYTLNLSEFLHTEIVLTCLPSFANEAFIKKKCDLHNNLIQNSNELIFKIPIILSQFKETNECAIYLPVN